MAEASQDFVELAAGREEEGDDEGIFDESGAMDPDHPLLRRAQLALKTQLLKAKRELEEDVREKNKALKDAQSKREAIGVELYGFQQQLANLQISLERSYDDFTAINKDRLNTEEELANLKSLLEDDNTSTKAQRAKADQMQGEMDDLARTLKQVELYNEAMKSEIAVTRRATYAAEESMQRLEKEKQQQDFLIDQLQETLKRKNHQLQMYGAQLEAQKRETRGAQETLAEAEQEMESIYYEKQQLVAQWKSSILAIQRRDQALQQIDVALVAQQEQAHSMETETSAYRREIIKEQVKNEQLTAIMQKSEGDMKHISQKIADLKSKQEHLHETYGKLQKSLEQTEERVQRSEMESKAIHSETDSVRKLYVKVAADTCDLKEKMLSAIGDQATAERSSSKTAKETKKLRQMVSKEEMLKIDIQNELAKLQVDILNTQSHNDRLQATLNLLDEELKEKERVAEKFEAEIQRKNDEVEKKTRELDRMNRQYERLTADMEDESTGPLEATINNLEREIQRKGIEAQELQRRWVSFQMELVTFQNENNKLSESMATLNCKNTIVFQKKRRLELQLTNHTRDIKTLDNGMCHLHTDIQRLNALIAKNSELQAILENDNFNLENDIMTELRTTEEAAVRLESQIDQAKEEKRTVLSEIIEAEREIMLWERKIQLQREMQDVLDPEVGQDVASAMKKEIHRMELRHADLMKVQERLIQEMERSVAKREIITTKGKAVAARKGPEMTEQQLRKACNELKRSIRDTDKESMATDQRIHELDEGRAKLAADMEASTQRIEGVKAEEQALRQELDEVVLEKTKVLLETSHLQKLGKGYEDVQSGRYKPCIQNLDMLSEETDKALDKLHILQQVIDNLAQSHPEIAHNLARILLHASPMSL